MAIKPTDSVIWLNEAGYYEDEEICWWGNGKPKKVYKYPKYWQNFLNSVAENKPPVHYKNYQDMQRGEKDAQRMMLAKLKSYGAEWKQSKSGEYIKFNNPAQMTMFIMKWS